MSENYQVLHQEDKQQFVLQLADEQALLQYNLDLLQQHIHFYHTFVPASARGLGLAQLLVDTALAWAKQQNYHISSSCSYVQRFLNQS